MRKIKNLICITARKGSLRCKDKNIRPVKGKPLVYYSIKTALENKNQNNYIVVSTDCPVVTDLALKNNIEIIPREKKNATAKSKHIEVLKEVIKKLESKNLSFEYLTLLQPTSPIRKKNLIKKAISILEKNKSFTSLVDVEEKQIYSGSIIGNTWKPFHKNKRTQDLPKVFFPTGNLFIFRVAETIKKNTHDGKKVFAMKNDGYPFVNIDYDTDFHILNSLLKLNPSLI